MACEREPKFDALDQKRDLPGVAEAENLDDPAIDSIGKSDLGTSNHRIVLTDVTAQSGVDFVHFYDGHDNRYILEPIASGMASIDFDNDGLIDLYFLTGTSIDPEVAGEASSSGASFSGNGLSGLGAAAGGSEEESNAERNTNRIFKNLGGMKFVDASLSARLDDVSFSTGVAVADFDNDGFADLFVNNFGRNQLYRNMGDGTFHELSEEANLGTLEQCGAGACFFDIEGDGDLDLYVGNYVQEPIKKNVKRTTDGFPSYPGPLDFEGDYDQLFENLGDGTFRDITEVSGIGAFNTTSMGVISSDFDEDGDADLIVVNDVERNLLFENDGAGKFTEVAIERGLAFSHDAQRNGNMGIDSGDFDRDGHIDFYTTTFSNDFPVLYQNDGAGNFDDVTVRTRAGQGLLPHANWGLVFADFENDRDLDLFIANGHTDRFVERWNFSTAWKVANCLLENDGRSRFVDISSSAGTGLEPVESSRGTIVEDLDNDGRVDLAVLNALSKPTIISNESTTENHWLQIELHGVTAPRDGTGSRVTVISGNDSLVAEVCSGRGYQSSYGGRLHFGLGDSEEISEVLVRWADGSEQKVTVVPVDRLLVIEQANATKARPE